MIDFITDLKRVLDQAAAISDIRANQWRQFNVGPLLVWQDRAFDALISDPISSKLNKTWNELDGDETTHRQSELLREEVLAIDVFQKSILDLTVNAAKRGSPDNESGKPRPLKKAMDLVKTLLESIKDIFGKKLGEVFSITIQLAIEAVSAFG
jgi:hypothetical protein